MNEAHPPAGAAPDHGSDVPVDETMDAGSSVRAILSSVGGQLEQLRTIQSELDGQALVLEERERRLLVTEQTLDNERAALESSREALEGERRMLAEEATRYQDERQRFEAWQAELEAERRALDEDAERHREERQRLEGWRAELDREQSDLHGRASALEAEAERIAGDRAALDSERQTQHETLAERDRALAEQQEAFDVERDEWCDRQRHVQASHEARSAALDDCERELAERDRALGEEQARQAEQRAAFEADRAELEERTEAVRHELEAAHALRAEAETRANEAEMRITEVETRAAEAETRIADAETRAAEAQTRIAEAETRATEAQTRIDDAQTRIAEAETRATEAETRIADAQTRIAEAETRATEAETRIADAQTRIAEADQRATSAESRVSELSARAGDCDETVAALTARCAEMEAAHASIRERAEHDLAAGLELTQEIERERDDARTQLQTFRAELEAAQLQRDAAGARYEEAEHALATLRERNEMLEAELAAIPGTPGAAGDQRLGVDVRVQAMQQRIAKLEGEVREAKRGGPKTRPAGHDRDDLRRKAERLTQVAEHLRRRYLRLRRLRQHLKFERTAVRPASVPLARPTRSREEYEKHAAQVRRLENERQALAERRTQMVLAQRTMQRRWARSRSVVVTGWLVFMTIVAGVLSWCAADYARPAIVSASVTLEAKAAGGTRALDEEALRLWRSWHMQLLSDEAFQRTVANRLAERRMDEYADPALLRRRLADHLSLDTTEPDEMTLTLVGHDTDELRMFLDLLATAVISESGQRLRKRTGAAWAVLKSEWKEDGETRYARAGVVPVRDDRLVVAAIILGPLAVLLSTVVFLSYRRLMSVKRELDADGTLFDDAVAAGLGTAAAQSG